MRKGARAGPFRAQLISESPLEIAQGENRASEQWDLRLLAGYDTIGLLIVGGFVPVGREKRKACLVVSSSKARGSHAF